MLRLDISAGLPPGFPYLTFFPAVILTTFVAGLWPGVLCAVLSGVAAWYFFIPPINSFQMTGPTVLALGFYVFIVTIDIALIHLMSLATDRLNAERRLTSTLYEQQRTMFQELQHRVANNMAFIAAILQLQQRSVPKSGEVAEALDAAIIRIDTMSRIHRRLYDPDTSSRSLQEAFEGLARDLVEISGVPGVEVTVEIAQETLDLPRLITLSQLLAEVVMNSLKHAFVGRPEGHIWISLQRHGDSQFELTVRDDGRGLGAATTKPGAGLGSRIVKNLGAQLGGRVEVTESDGVTTRLIFPA